MAGFYVDVPGFRFEYDRDGSILAYVGGAGVLTASVAEMQEANDEDSANSFTVDANVGVPKVAIAWPEVRDMTGIYLAMNNFGLNDDVPVSVSADTTNGFDGTWTALVTISNNRGGGGPIQCRTNIIPVTATAIRGVAFVNTGGPFSGYYTNQIKCFHVYGQVSLTENPDRLVLCDATGAVVTDGAYFDYDDSPRATTAIKTFKIRNNSATKTANSIAVSFETLYDASPTLAGQFQYDFGAGWVTTGNIGNLGPGTLSSTIQVRRNTLAGAASGPWQSRVVAVPASMT